MHTNSMVEMKKKHRYLHQRIIKNNCSLSTTLELDLNDNVYK